MKRWEVVEKETERRAKRRERRREKEIFDGGPPTSSCTTSSCTQRERLGIPVTALADGIRSARIMDLVELARELRPCLQRQQEFKRQTISSEEDEKTFLDSLAFEWLRDEHEAEVMSTWGDPKVYDPCTVGACDCRPGWFHPLQGHLPLYREHYHWDYSYERYWLGVSDEW
jgi:hypothetical protein